MFFYVWLNVYSVFWKLMRNKIDKAVMEEIKNDVI